jgi:hypothetical protein
VERQVVIVVVLGEQAEVFDGFRRVSRRNSIVIGPLSVSITPCMPPELFAPAGTFGFPCDALQALTASRATIASRRAAD